MSIVLAILAAALILVLGFGLGIILPRWARWDLRSALMLTIWGLTIVFAGAAFWVIV